ncbi:MAG: 2-C-methyl-D-erythritol 4-phosphate cytidylyltransferase [Bacteroidetes bacterium]|nr:2-C-methyl-D-erythritol 4-phosphate cytidylyltransferase [Bacteroidota bacterium]
MMKKYALIVAAGAGTRMQSEVPKQFLPLNGRPLFYYSVQTFLESFADIEIVLIFPKKYQYNESEMLQYFDDRSRIKIVRGGDTRFESVKNGLAEVGEGIVFIHDAVRPFINKELLTDLLRVASDKGNAIPFTEVVDSLRFVDKEQNCSIDRSMYKAIQTPQVFNAQLIQSAFEQAYDPLFTDDASVLEKQGEKINLVAGLRENIKITQAIDLKIAEIILKDWV